MKNYIAYFYTKGSNPEISIRYFKSNAWCARWINDEHYKCYKVRDFSNGKESGYFFIPSLRIRFEYFTKNIKNENLKKALYEAIQVTNIPLTK